MDDLSSAEVMEERAESRPPTHAESLSVLLLVSIEDERRKRIEGVGLQYFELSELCFGTTGSFHLSIIFSLLLPFFPGKHRD